MYLRTDNIYTPDESYQHSKSMKKEIGKDMKDNKQYKFDEAYAFAKAVAESDACDRSAFSGQENSIFLPYSNISFFYGEYAFSCQMKNIVDHGKISTFKRALMKLVKDKKKEGITLKLNGGKGHFEKCDICHNAEQLLKKTSLNKSERNIILAYRRRHIAQQFAERVKLRENIASTYEYDDETGQPLVALLFCDGMTVVKGRMMLIYTYISTLLFDVLKFCRCGVACVTIYIYIYMY